MHGHQVGAAFKTLHEFRQMLGRLGEIALQEHHGIASGVLVIRGDMPNEGINAGRVPAVRGPTNDRERHDSLVRLKDLARTIGAGIVVHDDVVLPGESLKHRSKAPEQDADRGGLIVDRDADAEHVRRVSGSAERTRANLTFGKGARTL